MEDASDAARMIARNNAAIHGSTTTSIVMAKLLGARPDLRQKARSLKPLIDDIVKEVNSIDKMDLKKYKPVPKAKIQQNPLPPLPDVKQGEVVTRFPPEPNGYPHIGHAKAAIINYEYARMYDGRLILRMDDTNPAAERLEFYAAIKVDLEWLGIRFDSVKNTSDDMELLHRQAARLIHQDEAYVCTCKRAQISENRKTMRACRCSAATPEQTHSEWVRMQKSYKPGEAILRYRGDMSSPNTTMRDPILFRIIDDRHPLLGNKYRTWPSYDLAVSVEDSIDGITHAFRSKEYEMRQELYHAIQDSLGLRRSHMAVFSRLALKDMPVSKRLIKPLLERGHITGFDDPRLPTLSGLRRRGIHPEAIRKFVLSLGFTKSDTIAPFATLEAFNRSIVDPDSVRLHLVHEPVRFDIQNAPPAPIRLAAIPGATDTPRALNAANDILIDSADIDTIRNAGRAHLMGIGDVTVHGHTLDIVSGMQQDIPHIQWVPAEESAEILLLIPEPPFDGDIFDDDSLKEVTCRVEPYYTDVPDYTMIQFVRFGYARKESMRQAIFTHK